MKQPMHEIRTLLLHRTAGLADRAVRHSNLVAAYGATVLYLEIIYIMIVVLFLFGKAAAISAALLLAAIYSAQLIWVYFKNNTSRIIQLLLMELHCAYSAAFIFNYCCLGSSADSISLLIVLARAIILAVEIPLIFLLTGDRAIAAFR
ncbi:MAG: hypothetical protein JXA20_11305 [Spirochaetes bacterium]|nr:hypothetical protein [Spirochaetota bacterium]